MIFRVEATAAGIYSPGLERGLGREEDLCLGPGLGPSPEGGPGEWLLLPTIL